eukprot:scaffold96_cov302-Prasinococcus_capsulatus_cf.AAC.12
MRAAGLELADEEVGPVERLANHLQRMLGRPVDVSTLEEASAELPSAIIATDASGRCSTRLAEELAQRVQAVHDALDQ